MKEKHRAPRNRTIGLDDSERAKFAARLLSVHSPAALAELLNRTVCQDLFEVLPKLPSQFVDLLIVDPPYNLDKTFNGGEFKSQSDEEYAEWVDSWLAPLRRVLKPAASVYICCDWRCSSTVQRIGERYFITRNRITWEREKGRGALRNWKNCAEDIWFFTVSREYTFNLDQVKLKRRVIAPYTDDNGRPKDWTRTGRGGFRLTHPSNLWTDISVPFWSMPENTDHPTQKPEKLIAKLILASSNPGDVVLDPFLGSGTTSVVAKKLGRNFVGIERDELYCCLAEKRLALAADDDSIQGYHNGAFWERNTLAEQKRLPNRAKEPKPHAASLTVGDRAFEVNDMNPRVVEVKPLPNYQLEITFSNGQIGLYDCQPLLDFGVFRELKDESYFRQVRAENGTVVWPHEQDICPDTLYLDSEKIAEKV